MQFLDATKTIAAVNFCFVPSNWEIVEKQTGKPPAPDGKLVPMLTAPSEGPGVSAHPPHPRYPGDAGQPGKDIVMLLLNRDTAGHWTVAQSNAQVDNPC